VTTDDYPLPVAVSWRDDAACKGHDTAIFYPDVGQSADRARAICDSCPVALDCSTEATLVGELGVWGGQTERERHGGRRSHHPAYRPPTAKQRLHAALNTQWATTHELADRLGISTNTAGQALSRLTNEGHAEHYRGGYWKAATPDEADA
jgi:hypothetical protein